MPGEHSGQSYSDRLRLALVALACSYDGNVLPECERDEDIDALFAAGLLATMREPCDEYVSYLTEAGRAFVRDVLAEEVPSHAG